MKLDLYCDTCQVPVCTKCHLLTHQQHQYRELATVALGCQDKLIELSKTAAGHITTLDKHRKELEASQTNIQRDANEACQKVHQAADELRSLVTKREQHLIQQIRVGEKTALREVKAACKETELNKASIQSLQSYIQALQVSGNITDQVVYTPATSMLVYCIHDILVAHFSGGGGIVIISLRQNWLSCISACSKLMFKTIFVGFMYFALRLSQWMTLRRWRQEWKKRQSRHHTSNDAEVATVMVNLRWRGSGW